MTTITKNDDFIPKNKKKKPGPNHHKVKKTNTLNEVLTEISKIKGWNGTKRACTWLGIPTNGGAVTTKQMSGYIGNAKSELRKVNKVLKEKLG